MHSHHIAHMVRRLRPVLKDKRKAELILERYWSDKIALVWEIEDVFRAANECGVALTKREAIQVLQELHHSHNAQYGIKWEDLTSCIEDKVLGRQLTKRELKRFEAKDLLTVQK